MNQVSSILLSGIKTSGKVAYFTSLFPYLVLLVLGVRGLTLPGAVDGVTYYLSSDWSRLTDRVVWVDAATQVRQVATMSNINISPSLFRSSSLLVPPVGV